MTTIQQSFMARLCGSTSTLAKVLWAEPVTPLDTLRHEVRSYLVHIREVATTLDVDLKQAERIASDCEFLLDAIAAAPSPEGHRVAQVACRYFVHTHDLDSDTHSPNGFVSDAKVMDAALAACGLPRRDM